MSDGAGPGAERLAAQLLYLVGPLVQNQPPRVAIEAMAAAFLAALMSACPVHADRVAILRRYAAAIADLADDCP